MRSGFMEGGERPVGCMGLAGPCAMSRRADRTSSVTDMGFGSGTCIGADMLVLKRRTTDRAYDKRGEE